MAGKTPSDMALANERLRNIVNNVKPDYVPKRANCWEVVNCGHESTCAVAAENRGRNCYLYDHTFCFGEDMGPFHEKIRICVNHCPFYKAVESEIGATWVEAHRQLAQSDRHTLDEAEIAAILKDRAAQLSHLAAQEDAGEQIDVIVFQLGQEHFALETRYVVEIRNYSDVTPVPCTPDFVLGITNIRGQIFSVLDIRKSLNMDDQPIDEQTSIILLSHKGLDVCLLVDRLLQKHTLSRRDIKSVAATASVAASVSGIFFLDRLAVSVINWDAYMAQTSLIVNEEV